MKLNSVLATVWTAVAATAAFGTDFYVDANNGDDAWSGTAAALPTPEAIAAGGTVVGPRKTLHAMMSDARVVPGDTVFAAEGDYNEGGDVNGSNVTSNRVQVKAGVTLCATGARESTFISGSGGSYDGGAYTSGAVRCVYFLDPPSGAAYGHGIVKGFTLRNGRTCSTSEHGGAARGLGLLVACDFRDNGCRNSDRGGTLSQGVALRCRFSSYDRGFIGYAGTKVIDSLVAVSHCFYSDCEVYNSTFTGNGYVRNGKTYNCLFIGTGARNANQISSGNVSDHFNTFSRSDFHETACTADAACRVVTAEETPYDAMTARPQAGSVAIDAGDISYYAAATNGWKAAWLAECGTDYYGGARVVNGAIDVGCGERQLGSALAIADDSDGLVVTGAEKGLAQIAEGESAAVTFSRTMTSDRLCLGVTVNGEFHSFGGTTSDVPYTVTFAGQPESDYSVAAVYETDQKDWYVSPTGDNANKGYHRNCPRRTLDKAMELAAENAHHVVHAAAGVYDAFAEEGTGARNRVVVKPGVGLVADEWPLRETVIQGASATVDPDSDGNGADAVRCVTVQNGGYVRGFKLTGGRTAQGKDNAAMGGGAWVGTGAALVDCELTGNACAYRGRAVYAGGTLIRCSIHDQVGGTFDVYYGTVVDSYVEGSCYCCPLVLNSTVTSEVRANGETRAINTYLYGATRGTACTNCVFMRAVEDAVDDRSSYDLATCRFSVARAGNLDADARPASPASPLVESGDRTLYDALFPAAWEPFKGRDIQDGQRVYNGQIDIGCGEYDYRADFARTLGPRAVISAMGPDVTTNAAPNVVVPAGETITLSMGLLKPDKKMQYDLVYTPAGGSPVRLTKTSADPFLWTLDGACTVQSLVGRVAWGFVMTFR